MNTKNIDPYKIINKLVKKHTNIEIKQLYKEALATEDFYLKIKKLSELSGVIAFYKFTKDNTHTSLNDTEKKAIETIKQLLTTF